MKMIKRNTGLNVQGNLGEGVTLQLTFSIVSGGHPSWDVDIRSENDQITVSGARTAQELMDEVASEFGVRLKTVGASLNDKHLKAFIGLCGAVSQSAHAAADIPSDVVYH